MEQTLRGGRGHQEGVESWRGREARSGGKNACAPPLAALPRNSVTSSIRERAPRERAFYIREASGVAYVIKVGCRGLWTTVVIEAELFGLVKMQEFQESCSGRFTSAVKTSRFENLRRLRCS